MLVEPGTPPATKPLAALIVDELLLAPAALLREEFRQAGLFRL